MTNDDVALVRDYVRRNSGPGLRMEISIRHVLNFQKMKTKIMESLLNITPVILLAVTVMQLYRANMELKYNYEALAWQMNSKNEQLDGIVATLFRRTHQNVQKTSCKLLSGLQKRPSLFDFSVYELTNDEQ
jgi:hypothetical protein